MRLDFFDTLAKIHFTVGNGPVIISRGRRRVVRVFVCRTNDGDRVGKKLSNVIRRDSSIDGK